MADYNKQTVANLRHLLKERSIPSTGLTRKAQIIEKLEQWDKSQGAEAAAGEEQAREAAQPDEKVEEEQDGEKQEPQEEMPGIHVAGERGVEPDLVKEGEGDPKPAAADVPTPLPEGKQATTGPTTEEPQVKDATTSQMPAVPPIPDAPALTLEPVCEIVAEHPSPEGVPTDSAMRDKTPSPSPDEKQSIEKPELLPIPEQSANATAEPSRMNSEELEAETRKRKRRSLTPDPASQDARAKKPRPSQDVAQEVHLKEDEDVVMDQRRPEDEKEKEIEKEKSVEDAKEEGADAINSTEVQEEEAPAPAAEDTKSPLPEPERKKEKAPRYKELFQPAADTTAPEALTDDRPIVPALHPATPALYIRNFMRPLRPEPLRAHLVSLATPPSSSPDASLVKHLFLDAMKTHALVILANTTAASRVRASLHGSIWPPEGNRKELWVDFIPSSKASEWITEEEDAISAEKEARASGRPIPAKKFEVMYPEDANGEVSAVFQEVGASAAAFNPPKGPRLTMAPTSHIPVAATATAAPAPPTQETRQDIAASFTTLSSLFLSTSAKPSLYYLPVSDARSASRLKDLDLETSRDWAPEERRKGRGMQGSPLDQKVRFTFDEEDRVVEAGGDFGPWTEREGFGGRGGGGGFRGRGGWRGDRGRGGWRSGF